MTSDVMFLQVIEMFREPLTSRAGLAPTFMAYELCLRKY